MTTERRLTDIEIKVTQHEDLMQALNDQVYRQQKKIDELQALCTALLGRIEALREDDDGEPAEQEKPPHY